LDSDTPNGLAHLFPKAVQGEIYRLWRCLNFRDKVVIPFCFRPILLTSIIYNPTSPTWPTINEEDERRICETAEMIKSLTEDLRQYQVSGFTADVLRGWAKIECELLQF